MIDSKELDEKRSKSMPPPEPKNNVLRTKEENRRLDLMISPELRSMVPPSQKVPAVPALDKGFQLNQNNEESQQASSDGDSERDRIIPPTNAQKSTTIKAPRKANTFDETVSTQPKPPPKKKGSDLALISGGSSTSLVSATGSAPQSPKNSTSSKSQAIPAKPEQNSSAHIGNTETSSNTNGNSASSKYTLPQSETKEAEVSPEDEPNALRKQIVELEKSLVEKKARLIESERTQINEQLENMKPVVLMKKLNEFCTQASKTDLDVLRNIIVNASQKE